MTKTKRLQSPGVFVDEPQECNGGNNWATKTNEIAVTRTGVGEPEECNGGNNQASKTKILRSPGLLLVSLRNSRCC